LVSNQDSRGSSEYCAGCCEQMWASGLLQRVLGDLDTGLTELQIQSYTGGLVAYVGSALMRIEQGPDHVYLKDSDENTQLSLRMSSMARFRMLSTR
jgi:hypothetical protein